MHFHTKENSFQRIQQKLYRNWTLCSIFFLAELLPNIAIDWGHSDQKNLMIFW